MEIKGEALPNKSRQSSKFFKKHTQGQIVPATLTCQPSHIRHKTKENLGTQESATWDWVKFTFLTLKKKQICSGRNNLHDLLQHEENTKFLNKTISPNESSLLGKLGGWPGFLLGSTSPTHLKIETLIFTPLYHPLPPRHPRTQFIHLCLSCPLLSISSSSIRQLILLLHSTYIYVWLQPALCW